MPKHLDCAYCIAEDHAAGHPPPQEPEPEPPISLGAVIALLVVAVVVVAPSSVLIWASLNWG